MTKKIIALCGPAGAGKTTLAALLCSTGQFGRVRFADPLKKMLDTLLTYQGVDAGIRHRMLEGDLKEEISPYLGNVCPRYAMQTLGTEWRDIINRELWSGIWTRAVTASQSNIVADDLRFLHEARAIRALSGIVVRLTRPGFGPSDHPSEQEYLKISPDFTIENTKTKEHMLTQLNFLLRGEVP